MIFVGKVVHFTQNIVDIFKLSFYIFNNIYLKSFLHNLFTIPTSSIHPNQIFG
jgi:hypothetical protein